jgi:hypothetical protein
MLRQLVHFSFPARQKTLPVGRVTSRTSHCSSATIRLRSRHYHRSPGCNTPAKVRFTRIDVLPRSLIIPCRLLHTRILLLRPILSHLISSKFAGTTYGSHVTGDSRSLSYRSFLQCAIVCVSCAQESIELIQQHKSTQIGQAGQIDSWWYNVLFLYTSAAVLIAARSSPVLLAEVSGASLPQSWRIAITVLEEYATFNTSIQFLIDTLKVLFNAVPQQYSRLKAQTSGPAAPDGSSHATTSAAASLTTGVTDRTDIDPQGSLPFDSISAFYPNTPFSMEPFSDLDFVFDPSDFSWLTTMPLDN